jgi:hypothetical protein
MIFLRLLGFGVAAGLLVAVGGCGGNGDCSDLAGAAAPCPPSEYGYARVEGTVLYADASPAVLVETIVDCQSEVGRSSNFTDQQGRYQVSLVYTSTDTVSVPLPPRAPDGSFQLPCEASAELRPQVVVRESVDVRFSTTWSTVTPAVVDLREPAP